MEQIDLESIRLGCPLLADELVGGEALERLESSAEVVGIDEIGEMSAQLVVIVVVEAFEGGLLDCPIHSLHLAVHPRMLDLGQPVLDAVFAAAHIEHMRHVRGCRSNRVAWQESKLNAVIGEHGVDFVWNGPNQSHQDRGG